MLIFCKNFTVELPSLQELLVDENNKRFDNSRWSLFFWLIGLDEISHATSPDSSKFLRIVLLTLTYLQYVCKETLTSQPQ